MKKKYMAPKLCVEIMKLSEFCAGSCAYDKGNVEIIFGTVESCVTQHITNGGICYNGPVADVGDIDSFVNSIVTVS